MASADAAVDWDRLRRVATETAAQAYAPYSRLQVGAAGIDENGAVVAGCNVENASYGLTLCAECGLVSALVAGGGSRLVAVSVVAGDGRPLTPCGRCRQLLMEHGGPDLELDAGAGSPPSRLADLLPGAFDGETLAARRRT
jgi:cytidine deaminase